MSDQSNAAAERSAHVTRGNSNVPAEWPVVQLPDGTWQLKAVVERDAEIEKLRAALRPFAGMADYCEGDSDSESACVFVGDLRQARAALGEKE